MSGASARRVAVGTTREHASSVFGLDHDDVLLTTFSDISDEVALETVHQLDVAAGEASTVLSTALALLEQGAPLRLRVELDAGGTRDLLVSLDASPDVGISEVARLGDRLVATLAVMERPAAQASRIALETVVLLRAPEVVEGAPPLDPLEASASLPLPLPPLAPESSPSAPGTAPPFTLRLLGRLLAAAHATTRRRQVGVVLGLLVGTVVLVLAVFGAVDDEAGAARAHVVLGALTLAGLLGVGALQLLVQRDVYDQRVALERLVRGQRGLIRRRTDAILRNGRALRVGQKDLPFVLKYLEAIDAAHSGLRAELRDWLGETGAGPREREEGLGAVPEDRTAPPRSQEQR